MSFQSLPSNGVRRFAFSLIEVLVAIGIIALLLGILLPTVTKVRKQAMTTRCQSNMRQILVMTSLYCNETDGVVPYTNWGDGYLWTPHQSHGVAGWAYDGNVPGNRGSFAADDIKTGVLWKFAGAGVAVFRCPLDVGPFDPQWYTVMTTFCANGAMSGFGGPARNISEFRAGEAAIYWEVGATASGGEGWDGANFPWEGISVRRIWCSPRRPTVSRNVIAW